MLDRKHSVVGSSMLEKSARSSLSTSSGLHSQTHSSVTNQHSVSQSVSSRSHRRGKAGDASRRGQAMMDRDKGNENMIKVLDPDTKEDRTPQSLLRPTLRGGVVKGDKKRSGAGGRDESVVAGSAYSEADERSVSRMESTESGSTTPKSVSLSVSDGEDMIEPLALDESIETSSMDSRQTEQEPKKRHAESKEKDDEDHDVSGTGSEERVSQKREMTLEEQKAWLNAPCSITLTETATFFLIEKPDEQIAIDSEEAVDVSRRNEIYSKLVTGREANKYVERGMQTFNNPYKNKETQFTQQATGKAAVGVTSWDIFDTMRRMDEEETDSDAVELHLQKTAVTDLEPDDTTEMDDETIAMVDSMTGGDDDGEHGEKQHHSLSKSRRTAWMMSPNLGHSLMIVERMIVQNIWQTEQLVYRNIDPVQFQDEPVDPGIPAESTSDSFDREALRSARRRKFEEAERAEDDRAREADDQAMSVLWRYGCNITHNRNVSCLSWNHANQDILAVGYGDYGISAAKMNQQGYVCCWSIKNPVYPERIIRIDHAGVSAVDCSHHHPSLLAVGHTDGTLSLYDIRKQSDTPALRSSVGGQHTGTVWEVKWVEKGKDRGESLISIAADGRVTDWSIKKGLECTNLIRLKRVANKQQGTTEVKGDALLSRQSGGMCVDFNPTERMIYIVGTEDGLIHKCSTSYNEQYLQDYVGHAGPVYRCRWSPFCSDVFLTCSADWTAKMWHENKSDPLLSFHSVPDAVHDVCWSPNISTVFGTITSTGRIDIWDLVDPLEPKIFLELEDRSLNCVSFANQMSAVMVVGDNKGDVTVLKLKGERFGQPVVEGSQEAQEAEFLKYLKKNTQ